MEDDLEAIKQEFLNYEFEVKEFDVVADDLASFAKACGEELPRYTDTGDADFQATPTWASSRSSNPRENPHGRSCNPALHEWTEALWRAEV